MKMNMEMLVWLLPLLFILHDMEEIVWGMTWKKREPNLKKYLSVKAVPFGTAKNAAGFSACVYEELLIVTGISFFSLLSGRYGLWFGMMAANVIHLIFLHIIGIPLVYHSYVPGFVTACLTVIPCVWSLIEAEKNLQYSAVQLIGWILIGTVIVTVNLRILHHFAGKIGDWIETGRSPHHV